MLAIGVELLAETLRATSADDLAATGDSDPGEWPPSPARLFAAFVAADGTGDRQRVTTGGELRLLEQAAPPRILADGASDVARSVLRTRFVVKNRRKRKNEKQIAQEYPARAADMVRPGTRMSPRTPRLWFTWPDLQIGEVELAALRARAARIGYLGCSDSPVRVQVRTEMPDEQTLATWEPGGEEGADRVALPVTYPGFLDALDDHFARFTSGESVRRIWMASVRRWYSTGSADTEPLKPAVVWLRFENPLPGRQALAVAEALRRATLELYDRWSAPEPGVLPPVLLGHGFTGTGYHHVHWLVLPDAGRRYARGRLHGAAVWFPPGTPAGVVAGVRRALGHLSELVTATGRSTLVRLYDGAARPLAASPRWWSGPARRWATVLPVVHERWGKLDIEQVRLWCRHAGLPDPDAFRSAPVPFVEGALTLRPEEVHRAGRERRPYSHLLLEFDTPVTGPVAIGRSRQFGMGLLLPIDRLPIGSPGGRHG